MTTNDLAGIIERDRQAGSDLPAVSAFAEYQALADRRALLGLLRETREAALEVIEHHFEVKGHRTTCPCWGNLGAAIKRSAALAALAEP